MKERKKFEIIKKISEILLRFNIFSKSFFTVVDIKMPKRGGIMKIYLSIFPENLSSRVISYFNMIRKEIKNEIRKNVYFRYLPSEIKFFTSHEFKEAQQVYEILEKLNDKKKNK